ncbi:sugar ABC transporter ATP-binding protein [Gemmata sp.]|uniref:sugar ABC transporter ATP-binding protein n=1 Tax=Gemmata sp. TaxID=1914242 RepID=UPI003F7082F2
MTTAAAPLLRMAGVTKTFGATTALAGAEFALDRGEVHALVGENGAGKSTLIKILTGAYRRDSGTVLLDGEPVDFRSPQEALGRGVAAVYQEVQLLNRLTVAENILLGREPGRWGLIDRRRLNAQAGDTLTRLGLPIDPAARLGGLPLAQRQMVAVARGVSLGARVLVLDEPTSSLAAREVETLFGVVRRVRAAGTGVVYVSHRFDELYALCDRVTVLRDGRHIATRALAGLDRRRLVELMLGREGGPAPGRAEPGPGRAAGAPALRAAGLRRGRALDGVSVEVGRGEVVGLGGLLGSGRTETARAVFGLDPPEAGEVAVGGRPVAAGDPRAAIAAGVGFLPEDRRAEGIVPDLSVAENLTLAALPLLTRFGVVSRARQRAVVGRFVARLRIKASPGQPIRELSGGNQQKVLLARWLCRNPGLLLLDEPTRGIDVGARAEIRAVIGELAAAGLGVLFISSELSELIEECGRVVVLRDGRTVADLAGAGLTEGNVMRAMAGGGET